MHRRVVRIGIVYDVFLWFEVYAVVAELVAMAILLCAAAAELLHQRRCRRIARLAFGPSGRPSPWVYATPFVRIVALAGISWGLVTLMTLKPKVHKADEIDPKEMRHLLVVLDVSPSMRLKDSGPTAKQSRTERGADLMESLFQRIDVSRYWMTVIAVYNGAKPVVVDTTDLEVVRNILRDLPMSQAFPVGQTKVFDGLEEAVRVAHPWPPRSASLLLLSDGDTVPATGMPKMPASISQALIVGVGDTRAGSFIDGRQSRQDESTLKQLSVRLSGFYHNGNTKQIPSEMLRTVMGSGRKGRFERLTRREYALAAVMCGALLYALLPMLLHRFGTRWQPGVCAGNASDGQRTHAPRPRELTQNIA